MKLVYLYKLPAWLGEGAKLASSRELYTGFVSMRIYAPNADVTKAPKSECFFISNHNKQVFTIYRLRRSFKTFP